MAISLEWGENVRYFGDSPLHWSPWLSKLGFMLESLEWIEVAKKLKNKGMVHLKDLWDDFGRQWLNLQDLR